MKREYTVVVEPGDDGYLIGSVPNLPGCFSQAKTVEELLERMKEAISIYLEEVESSGPFAAATPPTTYKVAV